ncbi:hypothetical protein QAD02_017283, partial [Eretmocerus hayati]
EQDSYVESALVVNGNLVGLLADYTEKSIFKLKDLENELDEKSYTEQTLLHSASSIVSVYFFIPRYRNWIMDPKLHHYHLRPALVQGQTSNREISRVFHEPLPLTTPTTPTTRGQNIHSAIGGISQESWPPMKTTTQERNVHPEKQLPPKNATAQGRKVPHKPLPPTKTMTQGQNVPSKIGKVPLQPRPATKVTSQGQNVRVEIERAPREPPSPKKATTQGQNVHLEIRKVPHKPMSPLETTTRATTQGQNVHLEITRVPYGLPSPKEVTTQERSLHLEVGKLTRGLAPSTETTTPGQTEIAKGLGGVGQHSTKSEKVLS